MIAVEEALDRILRRLAPLGSERVDVTHALHRVLAEDIAAAADIPPWPNSSMDGYALRGGDTREAGASRPARLRLAGRVAAGAIAERPLAEGEAYRIFTGAPLPTGADAVIPQEDTREEAGDVLVSRPVKPGDYVRPRGEDIRAGERVLTPGRVLGPPEVGLLAALGRRHVRVTARPRVGIVSTGDEIADLGAALGPGQIRNSNSYSLMAQVSEAGGDPALLGVARDSQDAIETRLSWGFACDMVISSAGVSVGEHDFVKAALAALGAEQHLWLVDMRPGKPIAFSTIPLPSGRVLPVFALPGNPVSAMVTFELFVRPALLKMGGSTRLDRPRVTARALAPIDNPGRRRGYLRVALTPDGGGYGARLTGDQSSGILKSMVEADGLAVVPGDTTIKAGDAVEVILLRPV